MAPIKIVLTDMPRALRELLLDALRKQPEMVVVDSFEARDCPDFLIVSANDGELGETRSQMLVECASMRVIVIAEGGEGVLYELRPRKTAIGALTPDGVVGMIRELSASRGSGR